MSRIVIFAGTTEGRKLSEWLSENKIFHDVCVATEYGEQILDSDKLLQYSEETDGGRLIKYADIHKGRLDLEQMEKFIKERNAETVVDATHPFAKEATENIKKAAENSGAAYLRLDRCAEGSDENEEQKYDYSVNSDKGMEADAMKKDYEEIYFYNSTEDCIEALKNTEGNILLTTGSKELPKYAEEKGLKDRLIVRVLPGIESIEICEKCGIQGKNIIAMQGPFSKEMNLALIRSYDIKVMVTKDSGKAGGFDEKKEAAEEAGIPLYVIGRPDNSAGMSFEEVCKELSVYIQHKPSEEKIDNSIKTSDEICEEKKIKIRLIGCGMGSRRNMTAEAADALEKAEMVFGAERLIRDFARGQKVYPYYLAKDIVPIIKAEKKDSAILFSGDSGFYSGAAKLYKALKEEVKIGKLEAEIEILPGISSASALAAAFGIPWEDAVIFSTHGKGDVSVWGGRLVYKIKTNRKIFALLSGLDDLKKICRLLAENGLEHCRILTGYQMSYTEQETKEMSPSEADNLSKEGLYSIFVINDDPQAERISCGISDSEFIRGKVPMTKEEVREVSIAKLKLKSNSIVYDIGSGTGSVAVEIANLSPDISVYAVEKKPEAISLIKQNAKKFCLPNIEVIEAEAPEKLDTLPVPTHAFIGGSSGNMESILRTLFKLNPGIRIVANAISFETLQELLTIEKKFAVSDFEIISMQVSRTRKLGNYNLNQAENPVWICSFCGSK